MRVAHRPETGGVWGRFKRWLGLEPEVEWHGEIVTGIYIFRRGMMTEPVWRCGPYVAWLN